MKNFYLIIAALALINLGCDSASDTPNNDPSRIMPLKVGNFYVSQNGAQYLLPDIYI
jgi:hypothetical protein